MKPHTTDYFEGILQIRNGTQDIVTWIHNTIRRDAKAAVTKEKPVKNGIDLYITDQHYLQNLGKKIKAQFTGILKVSKRLHTVDKTTSRHLYRITVLFSLLPFKRGDIITVHGEQVKILTIGQRAQVQNINSGAKKYIPLELLKRAR